MGRRKTIADEELLAVARRVFQEGGHAATTRDVAREAGVSQAVLYQRFRSKEDLFFAAMLPPAPDLDDLLGGEGADTPAYLVEVSERILAYFEASMPATMHLVTHPAFDPKSLGRMHDHVPAARIVGALAERLRALQERGLVGTADVGAAASVLVSALHTVAMFQVISGERLGAHAGAWVRSLVDVLWSGLAPDRSNAPAKARRQEGHAKG